jgi:hypothetical protein
MNGLCQDQLQHSQNEYLQVMPSRLRVFHLRAEAFCAEPKELRNDQKYLPPESLTKSALKSKFPGQLDPKRI